MTLRHTKNKSFWKRNTRRTNFILHFQLIFAHRNHTFPVVSPINVNYVNNHKLWNNLWKFCAYFLLVKLILSFISKYVLIFSIALYSRISTRYNTFMSKKTKTSIKLYRSKLYHLEHNVVYIIKYYCTFVINIIAHTQFLIVRIFWANF